ncbi:hypothetical protein RAC89_16165 [Paenibacillus sp. GD4]|nr:hypothetical protein [Paenibacillus sp. GD4]MDQ1911919.1 hypothetical protein [Paenibacillus sp. GD4]
MDGCRAVLFFGASLGAVPGMRVDNVPGGRYQAEQLAGGYE